MNANTAWNRLDLGPICRSLGLLVAVLSTSAPVFAFHDGGSASCDGCHIAHNSQDGVEVVPGGAFAEGLLKAETASDLCLSCHADSFGAVLGRSPLIPNPELGAGDFIFLIEDNLNDANTEQVIPGDAGGHNVDAPGHGLMTDSRWSLSPGGSFPAVEMECTSCHDPHGNTNFRLLYGPGSVHGGIFSFTRSAPAAVGISLNTTESAINHTAYRAGFSEWCANCHGSSYHETGLSSGFGHPSDSALGGSISGRYNSYNGDADPSDGSAATAYLAEAPFEDLAAAVGSSQGSTASSRVMCLTCHRAHASSAPAAGRWDFNVALLVQDGVNSGSYPLPNPYGDASQGTLCSKCHDGAVAAPVQ